MSELCANDAGTLLAELVREEMSKRNEIEQRIIANRVKMTISKWISSGQIPPQPVEPMTDQEALVFEREIMEFGKYSGMQIKDIPLDYLIWLADAGRKSWRNTHAYLSSPRISREIESRQSDSNKSE